MSALPTNKLTAFIDGIERKFELKSIVIRPEETSSDFVSFGDAALGGGVDWIAAFEAVQDPGDTDSLWYMAWANSGDEVPVILRPYGNAVASATQPHFTGNLVVKTPTGNDFLGGEADPSSSNRFTWSGEWYFTAKPTMITS